jgi:hypothetical protein
MALAGDSGVQLSRLLLSVQMCVKLLSCQLSRPGGLGSTTADQLWLEQLIRSRSLAYLVSSEAQVSTEHSLVLGIDKKIKNKII